MRKLPAVTLKSARPTQPSPFAGLKLGGLAVWLGLVAAWLYAVGQAYSNGYYRTYGVPYGLFDDSWHRGILAGSIYASSYSFSLLISMVIGVIFYFVLALVIGWISRSRLSSASEKLFSNVAERLGIRRANRDAMMGVGIASLASIVFAGVGIFYLLPMIIFEKQGATRATKEIEMIRTNDLKAMSASSLSQLKIERMEGTTSFVDIGINIGCQTNSFCIIRQKDKTVIVSLKSLVKMEATPIVAL
jgi:hypothetical protein